MEVKLITADGCWKIENVPEQFPMRGQDIHTACLPSMEYGSRIVTAVKRTYRYHSRDDHGMPIYKEVL